MKELRGQKKKKKTPVIDEYERQTTVKNVGQETSVITKAFKLCSSIIDDKKRKKKLLSANNNNYH